MNCLNLIAVIVSVFKLIWNLNLTVLLCCVILFCRFMILTLEMAWGIVDVTTTPADCENQTFRTKPWFISQVTTIITLVKALLSGIIWFLQALELCVLNRSLVLETCKVHSHLMWRCLFCNEVSILTWHFPQPYVGMALAFPSFTINVPISITKDQVNTTSSM